MVITSTNLQLIGEGVLRGRETEQPQGVSVVVLKTFLLFRLFVSFVLQILLEVQKFTDDEGDDDDEDDDDG